MEKTKIVRRSQKEMNQTREMVIGSLDGLSIPEHTFIGRTSEGLVFKSDEGLCVVIRVITKQLNFDPEEEITDFELRQELKKKKEKLDKK